jgi:KaiC/GvpD/RAD55 family RecA-like ATPase
MVERYSTGNDNLDEILGGGLIKGTKTLIYGPAGIGKSILGVSIAHKGIEEDKYPGLIINNNSSIDSQRQIDYAKNFFGWNLKPLF